MTRFILFLLLPFGLLAQSGPVCTQKGSLTTATVFTPLPNNTGNPNCNAFALTWNSTGFSAVTMQLQGADTIGGTYTAFTATTPFANPQAGLSGTIIVQGVTKIAFLQVKATVATGTGAINFQLYGYQGVTPLAGGGGGAACGTLGGDVTGTCAANTVVALRNHAITGVQGNGALAQLSTGSTSTGDCVLFDANGNTTDSGSPTCGGLTAALISIFGNTGPNITALLVPTGDSLGPSGTGTITATQVPTGAGATATTNGQLKYDTTLNNLHGAKAGADAIIIQATALTPGNGNCMNWVNSGGSIKAGDAGAPCGSGGGSGGGVLTYSGPTLSILSGTAFCPVGGGGACSATETNVDIDSSAVSTVSNMYVQLSSALGAGNSVAITWRKNASSQTVTCTISGASATSCNDTTHSFAVAQADLLDYQLVFTGTILVTPTITIMSQFGTVNAGITTVTATAPLISSGGTTPNISGTYQGNGAKIQASTGTTTTNDCVKFDVNGNTVDAGAACGTGSGGVTSVGGLTGVVPGGLILLEQHTASGVVELDFTTCISSSYDEYEINSIYMIPATNSVNLLLQFSTNGGSTWDTGNNYSWGAFRYTTAATAVSGNTTTGGIVVTGGTGLVNTSTVGTSNWMRLYNPLSTAVGKQVIGKTTNNDGNFYAADFWGTYNVTANALNAFRVLFSSGNITSGIVRCYGVAKQ